MFRSVPRGTFCSCIIVSTVIYDKELQVKRRKRVRSRRKPASGETFSRKIPSLQGSGDEELHSGAYWPWRRPRKKRVTLFLDADVLAWFKEGPKYQTRINRALWEVVKREKEEAGE